MKELYQLFGGYGHDPLKVFEYYFKHGTWGGDGYIEALIIAVVVVIICVGVFYFVIGNKSFKLSSIYTWLGFWVVSLILTFAITDLNTGMASSGTGKFGLQSSLDYQWRAKTQNMDAESTIYQEYQECHRNHILHFKKGVLSVKPVWSLCLVNTLIALLFFPLLSIVARKLPNKYAQNIPFK
jgi:hypothetical protein